MVMTKVSGAPVSRRFYPQLQFAFNKWKGLLLQEGNITGKT